MQSLKALEIGLMRPLNAAITFQLYNLYLMAFLVYFKSLSNKWSPRYNFIYSALASAPKPACTHGRR